MDNPLGQKPEEIVHGGQMSIVIGFVATFLLGVVFVFILGNLLGQISDNVQALNLQITGTQKVVVNTAATACLHAYVASDNATVLADTSKTDAVKMEDILNAYDADSLASLSTKVLDCTVASTPSYVHYTATGTNVEKTGTGLTVEAALHTILQ